MKKKIKKQPRVSIVFVNWNGKKYTCDLINSLKKITYTNYDIIVVDNGSTDNTSLELKKKYKNIITLIENKKNLGLPEGTNVGIREALKRKSKYVLVMNNDMVVKPDFLDILVEAMERHPEVPVSGPKIYYIKPKNMIWCAGCDYHISDFKPKNQNEIDYGQADEEKYVDGIDCVLMLRSSVLKKHGLFDPKLFLNQEFTEWCLRVKKFGYQSLYVPKSVLWHKVDVALEGNKRSKEISVYYNIRNWLLVIKKNKNFFYFLLVLLLQSTVFATIRFIRYLKNKQIKLIKTYYIAIWHALINKTPMELYPYKK